MFRILNIMLFLGIVVCLWLILLPERDPSEPNYEFVPERQMEHSPAFGAYASNPNFADRLTIRQRPPGTIPQGWQPRYNGLTGELVLLPGKLQAELDPQGQPFPYGPELTEMARAGKELKSPLTFGPQAEENGRMLYETYCQFCHGKTAMGTAKSPTRGSRSRCRFSSLAKTGCLPCSDQSGRRWRSLGY